MDSQGSSNLKTPSRGRVRSQQDRESSEELLRIYGVLLTPKQYAMTVGYCTEGKSFSQIAREQGVSRQAVHEAVRGVQRMLRYYEEKLQLKEFPRPLPMGQASGDGKTGHDGSSKTPVREGIERLHSLRNKITRKGIIYNPKWIVDELNDVIHVIDAPSEATSADNSKAPGKDGRR